MTSRVDRRSQTPGRARNVALLSALAALVALLCAAPASALSQRGHVFSTSFSGSGASQLLKPTSVAVNEVTGTVYVSDTGNKRVEMFNQEGQPTGSFQAPTPAFQKPMALAADNNANKAEDPSSGDVYVVDGGHVDKFDASGKFLSKIALAKEEAEEFGKPVAIAVDAKGVLWIQWSEGRLDSYTNAEPNVRTALEPLEPETLRPGLAVGPHDDLFVGYEAIEAFEGGPKEQPCQVLPCTLEKLAGEEAEVEGVLVPAGEVLIPVMGLTRMSGIVAEASGADVYVDEANEVSTYTNEGDFVQHFGAGHISGGAGIAVDAANGEVYVADRTANRVDVFAPEPAGAPVVDELRAPALAATGAQVEAEVDPVGSETTVTFEYGTGSCAHGGCTAVPAAHPPGAGFGDQAVTATLEGLTPGTEYHYRVLAASSLGSSSREGTFTTRTTFTLADSRAWELVSPPDKHGASIEAISKEGGLIQSSPDGNAVTFIATGPLEPGVEGNRSPTFHQIIARRSASGTPAWSDKDIAVANTAAQGVAPGQEQEYVAFSEDLSLSVVEPFGLTSQSEPPLSPDATEKTIYLRENQAEACPPAPQTCFTPIVSPADDLTHEPFGGSPGPLKGVRFEAASPDLSHVALSSETPLTSEGEANGKDIYMWDRESRQLRLINELPTGQASPGGRIGFADGASDVRNAVSSTGAQAFWGSTEGHLYVREPYVKVEGKEGRTVQIDVPEAGVLTGAGPGAEFQGASVDGSSVFFTDPQKLTTNSTATERQPDLYVCHLEEEEATHAVACHLTDLSVDTMSEKHANVQGFTLGVSEDATIAYFVANGVLSETENAEHQKATQGHCGFEESQPGTTCNVYVVHYEAKTKTWERPTFVTAISSLDAPDFENINHNLQGLTSRVSPKGEYMAFMSRLSLTGYDNRDLNPAAHEARDEEVYLYSRHTGKVTCVSCNPSGERPTGVLDHEQSGEGLGLLIDRDFTWSAAGEGTWLAGDIPGYTSASGLGPVYYQSRYLTDNGRLFFNSASPLVPQAQGDTRQEPLSPEGAPITVGVSNVYEYEPGGLGSCANEAGCVSLLSGGSTAKESAFLDASSDGSNVFLLTASPLATQDTDTNYDVYDARVCTPESPCVPPVTPEKPACASGTECKGEIAESPVFQTASTSSTGVGNAAPKSQVLENKTKVKPKTKPLTRAQLLVRALHACHKIKKHGPRAACERRARARYGVKKKKAAHKARHGARR